MQGFSTVEDQVNHLINELRDRTAEYHAGLLAVATGSGKGKLDAWRASMNKRAEIMRLEAELARVLADHLGTLP